MWDVSVRLRPLRLSDEAVGLEAHAELVSDDFQFLLGWDGTADWDGYVESKHAHARGEGLPPGWVANTFLLAELDGAVVGRVSVRHDLNEELLREGGHIGLGVRPDFRRRGIGTTMLRNALVIARSLGIERALVTCDDDNDASAAMIERVGGQLEDKVEPQEGGVPVRRYWID
jgi:predicted acetyltransferase